MEVAHIKEKGSQAKASFAPATRSSKGILARGYVIWLMDIACMGFSLYLGWWLRLGSGLFHDQWGNISRGHLDSTHLIALVVISVGWTGLFSVGGLYRRAKLISALDQILAIGKYVTLGYLGLLFIGFASKRYFFVETRLVFGFGWIFSITMLSAVRVGLVRTFLRRGAARRDQARRAVVVGALPFARRYIERNVPAANGYQVIGFVETREGEISSDLGSEFVLGGISSLDDIVAEYEIDEILIPIALLENRSSFEIVNKCSRTGLPVRMVSDIFQVLMPEEPKERVPALSRGGFGQPAIRGVSLILKRVVDLVIATTVVIVFSPLFLVIALLIKIFSPGPVLFRQIRAGKDGKPFTFYKFRTMRQDTDDTLHREYATNFIGGKELRLRDERTDRKVYKMPNDPRVTSIGRILRRTSLDELPQLFNVIKGDMSLVGPRPPIAYELTIYKEWHKRRLRIKPGITGLWQVSGRSSVPFHEMVLLDLYYINRWNLFLDFEIMLKTIPVVLSGKGAY